MKELKKNLKLVKLSSKTMKVIKAGNYAQNCTCRSCPGDATSMRGVMEIPSGVSGLGGGY